MNPVRQICSVTIDCGVNNRFWFYIYVLRRKGGSLTG